MSKKVTFFLPCRRGSQRVKNKNTKPFAGIKGGLLRIKLEQLLKVEALNKIVLSTNDELVISIAHSIGNDAIVIDNRPDHLCTSETSTDDLIGYVPSIIESGIVCWTHVTSPFVGAEHYDLMIQQYFNGLPKGMDSLMSVTKLYKFLWNKERPLNYDREQEKWPRTQTIDPVYEVNSAAFIADISVYRKHNDRIGKNVSFYEMDEMLAHDIDWEYDFHFAEANWKEHGKI